jgi:Domain of unknown function (4846)
MEKFIKTNVFCGISGGVTLINTMKNFLPLVLLIFTSCQQKKEKFVTSDNILIEPKTAVVYKFIGEIETPDGYTRTPVAKNSFAEWLRTVQLKKDKRVFLYNGSLKPNQSAQFAVVDIPVGNKDLQQCADAVMRLRAEYLYLNKKPMAFMDYNGRWYNWNGEGNRNMFDNYLQNVFGWCGSASLEKQLNPVVDFSTIKAGDVLVRGGFPGHAITVVDIATNNKEQKVYLLAQGYQPAQDIHVLNNLMDASLSPWYAVESANLIITPEWRFNKENLKTW